MDFKDEFGRLFTWEQFARKLRGAVYQEWGQGLQADAVDDALAEVLVDMLEHWVKYAKSVNEDGTYNLGYAMKNGRKRFVRFYARERQFQGELADEPTAMYARSEDVEALTWMETETESRLQEWFRACERGGTEAGVSERTARRHKSRARAAARESFRAFQKSRVSAMR